MSTTDDRDVNIHKRSRHIDEELIHSGAASAHSTGDGRTRTVEVHLAVSRCCAALLA